MPILASLLAEQSWPLVSGRADNGLPVLLGGVAIAIFAAFLDKLMALNKQTSLWLSQRNYLLASAAAGAMLAMLLAYLNVMVDAWETPADSWLPMAVISGLIGLVFMPAVLVTRLALASYLVKWLSRRFYLPEIALSTRVMVLGALALIGLIGGVIWPEKLQVLLWLSPLLLLGALQLAWHESTIFSGMVQGDWSRPVLAAMAGIIVGGVGVVGYALAGGQLVFSFNWLLLVVFGLTCLQVSDVIAELWRGKQGVPSRQKKPFPIPVVVQK
jgi:MFS family permease